MKYIGDRDNTIDITNDRSKVFSILDFEIKNVVVGYDAYIAIEKDKDEVTR